MPGLWEWFVLDPVVVARHRIEAWPEWRGPVRVAGGVLVECRRRRDGRVERFVLPHDLFDDESVDPMALIALRLHHRDAETTECDR